MGLVFSKCILIVVLKCNNIDRKALHLNNYMFICKNRLISKFTEIKLYDFRTSYQMLIFSDRGGRGQSLVKHVSHLICFDPNIIVLIYGHKIWNLANGLMLRPSGA